MTEAQRRSAMNVLFGLLNNLRYKDCHQCTKIQIWTAAFMAVESGLITQSSCNRILRLLNQKKQEAE